MQCPLKYGHYQKTNLFRAESVSVNCYY